MQKSFLLSPRSQIDQKSIEATETWGLLNATDSPKQIDASFADPSDVTKLRLNLRTLMFAFGDSARPLNDSVNLLEELLVDYLTQLALQAAKSAVLRPRRVQRGRPVVSAAGKSETTSNEPQMSIKAQDFLFALRKDPRKLARAKELLCLAAEIKLARSTTAMDPLTLAQKQENELAAKPVETKVTISDTSAKPVTASGLSSNANSVASSELSSAVSSPLLSDSLSSSQVFPGPPPAEPSSAVSQLDMTKLFGDDDEENYDI